MYIREVTISGIGCLADAKLTFKKGINVIVGKNGAGKSNILHAIQFVMCEDLLTLTRNERRALLHQVNSNQRRNVGFVEIVIECTRCQLALKKKDRFTRIRHTISENDNRFTINGKTVPKAAVKFMWKLANLSTRNSFYILDQGKVASLMDGGSERQMELLNDILGLSGHEKDLEKCYILFQINFEKIREDIESLFDIKSKECVTIKLQMEVLRRFENGESNLNTAELVLYTRNLACQEAKYSNLTKKYNSQQKDIVQITEDLNSCIAESEVHENKLKTKQEEINQLLEVINSLKNDLDGKYNNCDRIYNEGRSVMMSHIDTLVKRLASVEIELNNANCTVATAEKLLAKLSDESKTVKTSIEQGELELAKKYEQRIALYSKRERFTEYGSREERDQFIREEIERCTSSNIDYNKNRMDEIACIQQCETNLHKLKLDSGALDKCIEENEKLWKNMENEHKRIVPELRKCKNEKETIHDWLITLRDHANKVEGNFFRGELRTYRGIVGIIKEWSDNGTLGNQYHGLLIEKIRCDPQFNTAVDVVANKRLLFHIVETDTFATRLTKRFNEKRLGGTINLIAMNRIPRKHFNHQNVDPRIASPLLQHLRYDSQYDAIMNLIFGNVLVCVEESKMASLARDNRVNCVLLDGTYCSSKGSLSGGYFAPRNSKMNLQNEWKDLQENLATHETQLRDKTKKFIELTGRCDHLLSEMANLRILIKDKKLQRHLGRHEEKCSDLTEKKNRAVCKLADVESLIAGNNERISFLQRELNSDFLDDLPPNELEYLHDLCKNIKKIEDDIDLWKSKLKDLQNRIKNTAIALNENKEKQETLMKEKTSINSNMSETEMGSGISAEQKGEIDEVEKKLKHEYCSLEKAKREISNLKEILEQAKAKKLEIQGKSDQIFKKHMETNRKMKTCKIEIAYFKFKLQALKKVTNVDIFDYYNDLPNEELLDAVSALRNEMTTMSQNVNKRAAKMHEILQRQLREFKTSLNQICDSKRNAIQYLDEWRFGGDAIIAIAYHQIKASFQEGFQLLVPDGYATMAIWKNNEVTGLEMNVSFNGQQATRVMKQLSGSQKTLVTLAFLFSIQSVVHTPVFLFDEIDANLDASFTRALATEIERMSKGAQFIMTTHKHNFVTVADKHVGVSAGEGASRVHDITQDQAFDYLSTPSPSPQDVQSMLTSTLESPGSLV